MNTYSEMKQNLYLPTAVLQEINKQKPNQSQFNRNWEIKKIDLLQNIMGGCSEHQGIEAKYT